MTVTPTSVAFPGSYQSSPAYTQVPARRTLTSQPAAGTYPSVSPSPNHQMSSPATAKKKIEWPLEVRQYVQKCFFPENAIPSVTREELEARLKRIITDATDNNNLYTANWAQMPLPQQMIVQERNAAMLSTPVNPWNSSPVNGYRAPQNVSLTPSSPPQKRKSSELASASNGSVTPPWRQSSNKPSFADRVTAPLKSEKRQKLDVQQKLASKFDLEKRQRRFERDAPMTGPPRELSPSKIDASGPVIGRSQKLEKNYFRLTAPPNPETVRPLPILKQTLELLKKKWRKENNYTYICDQFKSLRQDLTVQHIKNDFTVNVYEIHARIALEKGDLGEYNQCQTQLRALYRQKLGGHPTEFLAYRILYFIHTCNRSDMNDVLADLTPADKTDGAVKHALDVRSALALGNYHRFFQLYLATPNMGAYLMDMFVGRERLAALSRICKAYKPDVKIRFVTEELGFESDEQSARFILEYASEEILQEREDGGVKLLTGKAGNLFEAARANAFKLIDLKGQI